jgi:hypothetical protein
MEIVHGLLKRMGRIKYPMITPRPKSFQSQWAMMLVSPLLNRKRQDIGTIRVMVTTFNETNNIRVRVEWTRHAFGFWYRQDVWLSNAAMNPRMAKLAPLENAFGLVRLTADGGARLKGMIRVVKKIKKNQTKDRAMRQGLMMG